MESILFACFFAQKKEQKIQRKNIDNYLTSAIILTDWSLKKYRETIDFQYDWSK